MRLVLTKGSELSTQVAPRGADDPRHAPQGGVGLADVWFLDDGDMLCLLCWCYLVPKHVISPTQRSGQQGIASGRKSSATSRRLKELDQNETSITSESRRK